MIAYGAAGGQFLLAAMCVAMAVYLYWFAIRPRRAHAGLLILLAVHFGRVAWRSFLVAGNGTSHGSWVTQPDIIAIDTLALILGFILVAIEARDIHRERMREGQYP